MIRLTSHEENREGVIRQRTFTYSGDANNGRTTLHFKVTLVDTGCNPDQWQCRAEFENFDPARRYEKFAESEAIGSGDDPESALRKLADNLRRVADAIDGPTSLYSPDRVMPPWVFPSPEPEPEPKAQPATKATKAKKKRRGRSDSSAQRSAEGGEA